MKSVSVTMFFDLKSLPDATTSVRPVEFYVENGRTTLSTKSPMVIFCDETTKVWIEKLRNEVCPEEETIYIVKKITDYDFYKLNHSIIKENREKLRGYFINYFLTIVHWYARYPYKKSDTFPLYSKIFKNPLLYAEFFERIS
jgi:hypothetical protein